jgi:spermidine/putrescine transport system ATP-binding protein/putrescine transport system ATP-binding protein
MTTLLQIRDISKSYDSIPALSAVSLEVKTNEFFAILGPSGSGKTTLLRALAGFESLDSGDILLEGESLVGVAPNKRPINLMFQSYALFPHLSVFDNVAYGLRREGLPSSQVTERVTSLLNTVGLQDLAKRRPHQLSGGQKQRVALARAMVKRPKLLLLDEPLSALDRKVREEMQLELKRLQAEVGITFVVVTHDQEEAMSMADRIAVMDEGRVVQVAHPAELYKNPANSFVASFIGTSTLLKGQLDNGIFRLTNGVEIPCSLVGQDRSNSWLMLRPEDITAFPSAKIRGTVVSTNFYGPNCLVVAECGLGVPIKYLVGNTDVPEVGASTAISWSDGAGVIVHES